MLPTAARADDAKPKQDKPKDPKGAAPAVIAPAEAAKKVGEKVTVEMAVASTGGRGKRVFLNSEKSFRDGKNFTIMLDLDKAGDRFKEAKIDDPAKHYAGKTIRVTGTVSEYQNRPEIIVTDPEQIKVVEK
jgi:DNA/RNA endonuclease YhcR with UshA esterase domain